MKIAIIASEAAPFLKTGGLGDVIQALPQALSELPKNEVSVILPYYGKIKYSGKWDAEFLGSFKVQLAWRREYVGMFRLKTRRKKLQVYFIDNDDYFHKRKMQFDENGEEYPDNTERAIFYARGVLETLKKLRWCPDLIHCQGWMSAIAPLYIKTAYREDPPFANAKVVYTDFNDYPKLGLGERFAESLAFRGASIDLINHMGVDLQSPDALGQIATAFSDGLVEGTDTPNAALTEFAAAHNIPVLHYPAEEEKATAHSDFYESLYGSSEE